MSRVSLTSGSYLARHASVGYQRCENLYGEAIPQETGEPPAFAYYPTPGLRLLGTIPGIAAGYGVRGLHWASSGALYAAAGDGLFKVNADWTTTKLGTIAAYNTPVSMADNSLSLLAVDGTGAGYTADLATDAFGSPTGGGFYGSRRVTYLDTYFGLVKGPTQQFYVSDSLATSFDALQFAAKVTRPDLLVAAIACQGELWLIGERTTEVWTDSGAADFPFQRMSGGLIERGCCAPYSIAGMDNALLWLSQSPNGERIAVKGSGYQASRISDAAVEAEWAGYSRVDDAEGWCYEQGGHAFYVLLFPTAGRAWCWDATTGQWHRRVTPGDVLGGYRARCHAAAYGLNVVGDYLSGRLFALDPAVFTDAGLPVQRTRGFPHRSANGQRVFHDRFVADMACDPGVPGDVSLRWSDDRGASWGNPVTLPLGGAANTSLQFRRLGYSRDRVYECSWASPARTALMGAYLDARAAGS